MQPQVGFNSNQLPTGQFYISPDQSENLVWRYLALEYRTAFVVLVVTFSLGSCLWCSISWFRRSTQPRSCLPFSPQSLFWNTGRSRRTNKIWEKQGLWRCSGCRTKAVIFTGERRDEKSRVYTIYCAYNSSRDLPSWRLRSPGRTTRTWSHPRDFQETDNRSLIPIAH